MILDNDNFKKQFNSLKIAKRNNKLSNAYIIYNNNIKYQDVIINDIAKLILCNNSDSYCNSCKTCNNTSLLNDNNKFITILQPSHTNNISIGEDKKEPNTMRWFQNKFYLSSLSNTKKIGIILEAEKMHIGAQNAFLKTLEEPPKNSYFLIATSKYMNLLPTIRSRCTLLRFIENIFYDKIKKEDKLNIINMILETKTKSITDILEHIRSVCNKIGNASNNQVIKNSNKDFINSKTIIEFLISLYNWISEIYLSKTLNSNVNSNLLHRLERYINVIDKTYNNMFYKDIFRKELLLIEFSKNLKIAMSRV